MSDSNNAEIPVASTEDSDEFKKPLPSEVPNIEAVEEAKLRAKFPNINRPMGAHSAFLQKRLAKGQKYFDSGDYQMAKQKPLGKCLPAAQSHPTGDAIPTPESVPVRKTSIIQPSKFTSAS